MTKKVLGVPDISCDHCERAIRKALAVGGVTTVAVDIPAHQVAIDFDETVVGLDRIKEILLAAEYPVATVS
jgi:copper chaperone CopZ